MSDHALKPSELKLLLRCNGIKNYKWKGFFSGGSFPKMLLENSINNQVVIGKIVSLPTEELQIWPQLQHQNLNPLLDILFPDNYKVRILISPAVGKCIGNVIQDSSFLQHPMCFERKKSYAKDILLGISYMHQNNIRHLNLNDTNVEINAYTDKAVICDFSYATAGMTVTVKSLPSGAYYRPAEVENARNDQVLSAEKIDVWNCGLLFLQIFTQHLLPWCGVVKNSLEYLDSELLRKANVGACLQQRDVTGLRMFQGKLLHPDPNLRISADDAIKSSFLRTIHNRLDRKARRFWKTGAIAGNQSLSYSLDENNFTNSETGSFYSEIDILTISEDNTPSCLHHSHASRPASVAHLVRTKSEPGARVSDELPNSDIQVRASFPTLCRNNNSKHSSNVPEICDFESDATALQDGSRHRHEEGNCTTDQDAFKSSEVLRRSPYDIFLTEWEPNFFLRNAEAVDLSSIPHPDSEELKSESEQAFSSPFASSLEGMPQVAMPRVGKSPNEYCSRTEKRRKMSTNSPASYRDAQPNAWYADGEYLETQRQVRHLPPYINEDCQALVNTELTYTSDPLLVDYPSKKTSSRYPTGRKRIESADCVLPHMSDASTEIFQSCREIRSRSDVIVSVPSEEDQEPLSPCVSKNLKDACSRKHVESDWIVGSERQLNSEENKLPPRKRWYHRLCPGCKSKRK